MILMFLRPQPIDLNNTFGPVCCCCGGSYWNTALAANGKGTVRRTCCGGLGDDPDHDATEDLKRVFNTLRDIPPATCYQDPIDALFERSNEGYDNPPVSLAEATGVIPADVDLHRFADDGNPHHND